MSYQPVELISKTMMFRPEDLIEHRLTSDGRKVKFEHMAALNEMLEEVKKYVYLEQTENRNSYGDAPYIQRLHLWVVPPEQIQVRVYDELPKQFITQDIINQMSVRSQYLKRGGW